MLFFVIFPVYCCRRLYSLKIVPNKFAQNMVGFLIFSVSLTYFQKSAFLCPNIPWIKPQTFRIRIGLCHIPSKCSFLSSLKHYLHKRSFETCGQSYKHFMLVNYDSTVVIWGIFQSGTRVVIYERKMFIRLVTDCSSIHPRLVSEVGQNLP